uniref:Putative secreted protein n=1 Tax=Ixodes scapularis TaxID=6945 RepID=A0A4D5RZV9_IXOSC
MIQKNSAFPLFLVIVTRVISILFIFILSSHPTRLQSLQTPLVWCFQRNCFIATTLQQSCRTIFGAFTVGKSYVCLV